MRYIFLLLSLLVLFSVKSQVVVDTSFTYSTTGVTGANVKQMNRPNPLSSVQVLNFLGENDHSVKNHQEKTLQCGDTVRYPMFKEVYKGTGTYAAMLLLQLGNEKMSQNFLLSGGTISISGVEFYGRVNTTHPTVSSTLTVRASIYSLDANGNPQNQLGSGTVTFTSTTNSYHYVNFGTPVSVSSNYAVVIEPINDHGGLEFFVNDPTPNQIYDEGLARIKSDYWSSSNGSWITIPQFTEPGNYDFEPLVAPIISYTMNTSALATPDVVCQGTAVNFTGTASPSGIISSRMYSLSSFHTYWGTSSTNFNPYFWDFDDSSPVVTATSANHTYSNPGVYDATYYVVSGLENACIDYSTDQVTVNAMPNVSAGADVSICNGSSTTLSASGAVTYSWSPATGLSATTGASVTASPTATTTYTVTGTSAGGCTSTDQVTVTANALPNVSAGADVSICNGSSTTLSASGAVNYSWSPATGLSATTGALVTASPTATTTYTVTGTSAGGCTSTDQVIVTVNATPVVTQSPFSDLCLQDGSFILLEGLPSGGTYSGTGVSAGIFNPTIAGIGTHTITYSYTDVNNCSSFDIESIVVEDCASIDEIIRTSIIVSPNPATDLLKIVCASKYDSEITWYMFTEDGRIVVAPQSIEGTKLIDVSQFAKGIYFIHFKSVDGTLTKKVIVK